MTVVVTGASVLLAGDGRIADLSRTERPGKDAAPADPAARMAQRGLRYKDRATKLALAAAAEALADAGLREAGATGRAPAGHSIGVVASSGTGNLDTVCRVVATIAAEGTRGTSPMDLPNASSNVVASSIAIQFGLQGPNLMLCNGGTGGLDALLWARHLLAAGRADQVVVVGVETDNEVVRRLTGSARPFDGAAAVVLEERATAQRRDARERAVLAAHHRGATLTACLAGLPGPPGRWHPPAGHPEGVLPGVPAVDLTAVWGDASGALGVLQCAAAVAHFDADGAGPVLAVCGADGQPFAGLSLHPPVRVFEAVR